MDLSGASLSDLVAELRERLRRFASRPPRDEATPPAAGPLAPAGRAALAARLLAVVLDARRGPESAEAARALEELAAALTDAPAPLPGSAWEADLRLLARTLESLAGSWDEAEEQRLPELWRSLRAAGDRLWAPADPPPAAASSVPAPSLTPSTSPPPARPAAGPVELWLLVAGTLRRDSLRRRLVAAGLRVRCLDGVDAAVAALADTSPTAILSDDAAPARFHSRLLDRLPRSAPPVVLVRSGGGARGDGELVWRPPYDPGDLLARLGR